MGGRLLVQGRCPAPTVTGDTVAIWTCDGSARQKWDLAADGTIRNGATDRCLTATGGKLTLSACDAGANQVWNLGPKG